MKSTKIFATLACAAVLATGLGAATFAEDAVIDDVPSDPAVAAAIAAMTPDELVKARKDAMRQNGGLLREAGSLTGEQAVAATQTMIDNFDRLPALFPEGSITPDSKALPVIWEDWANFVAIFNRAEAASREAQTAAQAGDAAAYGAALGKIGAACGECHSKYRS